MNSHESATDELDRRERLRSIPADGQEVRQGLRDLLSSRRVGSTERSTEQSREPEQRYASEYIHPDPRHVEQLGRQVESTGADDFASYADKINPRHGEGVEWELNCGSCSRAFALTFQTGEAHVASGRGNCEGEEPSVMYEWAGVEPDTLRHDPATETAADFDRRAWARLAQRSEHLPDGTVLVVGVDWEARPGVPADGHWFNAVREGGQLHYVDGQDGRSGRWPPSFPSHVVGIDAVHRTAADQPWKELNLAD